MDSPLRAHSNLLQATALLLSCALSLAAGVRAQESAPSVVVGTVRALPVTQEVPLTGTVRSPQVARLSSEVRGWVESVAVEEGDRVERGAPLLRLDRELAELELRSARAALREGAEKLADAQRRLANAERLSAEDALAESALLSRRAEVKIAEAALERLEAEQQQKAALLQRHELRAPFSGAITQRLTHAGEWIEPGTAVFELLSTDDLRVDFQVPQEIYPRVQPGAEIEVTLDAAPEPSLRAHVLSVVPQSDVRARTFQLIVQLDSPQLPVIPGMSARAVLRLGSERRGLAVPRDALLRHPDGRVTVWVLAAGGVQPTVTERRVQTGQAFGGMMEIVEGLSEGDRVVLRGNEALQQGQPVRVEEASSS